MPGVSPAIANGQGELAQNTSHRTVAMQHSTHEVEQGVELTGRAIGEIKAMVEELTELLAHYKFK